MKQFSYKAREVKTGKMVKGTVQADTERAAGKLLLEQGYSPEKISEQGAGSFWGKIKGRVTSKDRIVFTRQFATLLTAGLPLSNCLKTLSIQTTSSGMKAVIDGVLARVEAGKSLSEALGEYPDVFDEVFISLVAAGEASGTLDIALEQLATQDEKDDAMLSSIKQAMVYPIILLVVIVAVLIFMMVSVVPQVTDLYDSMGETLPALTTVLVGITDFLTSSWIFAIIAIVIIVILISRYKKTPSGLRLFAKIKLNVPIFKDLFLRLYMTRFARTMQILLDTGVSMLDAMKISSRATANEALIDVFEDAMEKVKGGKPLSVALENQPYILPLVPQMASIGEESGKIGEMLGRAARAYENELDSKIKNISTLIEPVLMIALAGVIAIVIMGTLMPIYQLVSSVG